jgi:hypothetical protein
MGDYISTYEWEVLREPITVPKIDDTKELPDGQKKIVITRDDHYKLQAVLYTKGDPEFFRKKAKNIVPGSFVEPFEIIGSDQHNWRRYTLESCYLSSSHSHWEESGEEPLCESDLRIQGLRIRHKKETEGVWLTEWYINGPQDSFVFRNQTIRKMLKTFSREHLPLAPEDKNEDENIHTMEVSLESQSINPFDCLRIKACDNQFLIAQVPEGIGPAWSSNIGIEYRKEWGRIPDEEEREKIRELCSFVFGRQLLFVGYSLYGQGYEIVEEYACDSWINDSRSLCSKLDNAPIRINKASSGGKAEDLISQLLPAYYELRDPLHLKVALLLYWVACNMPAGTGLPLLAAAVEKMMNGWFKSNRSKSRGVWMDKNEFDKLLRDEMSIIEKKLKHEKHGDKVMKNLQNAFQMGVTDRFRLFFDKIVLHIEENEWNAINARHGIAHGRITDKQKEGEELIQHTDAYKTLIHKILLRLLEYSGSYIDRSVLGWKDKQLEEEIPRNENGAR